MQCAIKASKILERKLNLRLLREIIPALDGKHILLKKKKASFVWLFQSLQYKGCDSCCHVAVVCLIYILRADTYFAQSKCMFSVIYKVAVLCF